jgi:hypothetical protein
MPAKRPRPERSATQLGTAAPKPTLPLIPAEAALRFLIDTKGTTSCSAHDLADMLKIRRRDGEQVVALLAAQGYVQHARGADDWMTTPAGESVSGAKTPRFTGESVERAVEALKERIRQVNKDSKATFRIADAVAFGEFLLSERTRVQAADVGTALTPRGETANDVRSASAARLESQFLRQVRRKTALVQIRSYAEWMRERSHLNPL